MRVNVAHCWHCGLTRDGVPQSGELGDNTLHWCPVCNASQYEMCTYPIILCSVCGTMMDGTGQAWSCSMCEREVRP